MLYTVGTHTVYSTCIMCIVLKCPGHANIKYAGNAGDARQLSSAGAQPGLINSVIARTEARG